MATDDRGWNPLVKNPHGIMTDQVNLGHGVGLHGTFDFPDQDGTIGKSHTTIGLGSQQIKMYPTGQTSLHLTKEHPPGDASFVPVGPNHGPMDPPNLMRVNSPYTSEMRPSEMYPPGPSIYRPTG